MGKTIYYYTDDSWADGHEDCPCCSRLLFECYNAEGGWPQNGSATDKWGLYKDVLAAHKYDYEECVDFIEWSAIISAAYEGLTLEELESLCERLGVVLEEV